MSGVRENSMRAYVKRSAHCAPTWERDSTPPKTNESGTNHQQKTSLTLKSNMYPQEDSNSRPFASETNALPLRHEGVFDMSSTRLISCYSCFITSWLCNHDLNSAQHFHLPWGGFSKSAMSCCFCYLVMHPLPLHRKQMRYPYTMKAILTCHQPGSYPAILAL